MKLIILITAKIELGIEVAQSWREVGAPGVTIIPAHGLRTLELRVTEGSVELPRMLASMASAMASVMNSVEQTTQIFLSVMPQETVPQVIEATQKVLGDLLSPDTGVIFVLDIEQAIGVTDHSKPN